MKDSKLGMVGRGGIVYDGKRMRKAVHRRVLDYTSTMIKLLQYEQIYQDFRDFPAIQPVIDHTIEVKLYEITSSISRLHAILIILLMRLLPNICIRPPTKFAVL